MTGGGNFGSILPVRFGVHETLDARELAVFKTLCLTKSKTMRKLVADPELQELMVREEEMTARQLQELDGLLARAVQTGGNDEFVD